MTKITTWDIISLMESSFGKNPSKVFLQLSPELDLSELDVQEIKEKTGVEVEVLG